MTSRFLLPSMRTPVPEPVAPPAHQHHGEVQRAVIAEADAAPHAGAGEVSAARAVPAPADTRWPEPLQVAWESYRQAAVIASRLKADYDEKVAAAPDTAETVEACDRGLDALYDAESAWEDYRTVREQWYGPSEFCRDYFFGEPEADS